MITLNLLPDVKREYIKAQRSRNLVVTGSIFVMLGAFGLVALLALYVYLIQPGQDFLVSSGIKDKAGKLEKVEDIGKYLTIQNQLAALPAMHVEKPAYSRLFEYLPTLNPAAPNNIAISKLTVDEATKTIVIEGNAPNYGAVTVFKNTLENAEFNYSPKNPDGSAGESTREKLFSSVVMSQVAISQGTTGNDKKVAFTATITYENVFSNTVTNATVSVPNLDTTDSVRQSPTAIFGGSTGN